MISDDKLRDMYASHLLLERGLARNSVAAYTEDVNKLLRYLASESIKVEDVTLNDLQAFAASIYDLGIAPRTLARIISGMKSFFKWLHSEGHIQHNPTLLFNGPKVGRKLPEILSVEDIDTMIANINVSTFEGVRNLAIIETLYGCR